MAMLRALLFFCLLVTAASAAPLERDLGRGLIYCRVQELPKDLPTRSAKRQPCVVDIRYVRGDSDAASAFHAWVTFHASTRSPVFLLANPDTASALLKPFVGEEASAAVITIGRSGRGFAPDIAVRCSAEDERRAYDALTKGAGLGLLTTDNPEKPRNDEASLSKDRLAEASADSAVETLQNDHPSPPIDVALQRAIHLHRAFVALKKL